MTKRFVRYVAITRAKLILWALFMTPYAITTMLFSSFTPQEVKFLILRVFYETTLIGGVAPASPPTSTTSFGQLTLGYLLVTYLLACIFVDIFDILWSSKRKKKPNAKKSFL